MREKEILCWFKRILLLKVVLISLMWAPALFVPVWVFNILGINISGDFLFVRLFGALQSSLGVAYYFAYREPAKNSAIIKVAIFENVLVSITIIFVGVTTGISSWFVWVSCGLTIFFGTSLLLLYTKWRREKKLEEGESGE